MSLLDRISEALATGIHYRLAKANYPEFAYEMDYYSGGYKWEPHEVTTEDGYILTVFHITGRKNCVYSYCNRDSDKPSILF